MKVFGQKKSPNGERIAAGFSCAAMLLLAGCVQPVSSPLPDARPSVETIPAIVSTPAQAPVLAPVLPSKQSQLAAAYYTNVQNDLLTNYLLRTDGGGADTPYTARQLAANFDAIALNDEYTRVGDTFVASTTPSNLHRWQEPVRIALEFGASVPEAQRNKDRKTVANLSNRLARATQHPISYSGNTKILSNFHVLVLNEDERKTAGPRLEQLIPGLGQAAINSVINMPRTSYCLVLASDPANNGVYRKAVAVIRGEHPDLLRQSCLHEEISQGLGLANDSPRARPSIFNDDEEFAFLTPHDELLLRILYDDRLTPGMSPEVARHISAQIAAELLSDSL